MRGGSDGAGARGGLFEGSPGRKCADYRGGAAVADVSAKRYFAGELDLIDFVRGWGGGGNCAEQRGARTKDTGFGDVYVSGLAGGHGIRPAGFWISHFAGQRRSGNDREKNPRAGAWVSGAPGANTGRDQGMDFASGRRAPSGERGRVTRVEEMPDAAVMGHSGKRR